MNSLIEIIPPSMRLWRATSPGVLWTIAGLFGLLIVASLAVRHARARAMRLRRPQASLDELRARVRTWWVMVTIFTLAMLISRAVSLAFFALISFLALKEYLSLIPTRRADRRVLFWAYLAIPFQYYWIHTQWYGLFVIFIPVYVFLLLPLRMILIGETAGFLRAVGTIHWGLMTMVYCISHVAFLLVLPPSADARGGGPALVLYLVVLTQLNDVAQYIWGKSFGRHAVVPTVSPKKTVEGLAGGVATTLVLAMALAPLLTPLTVSQSAVAGLMIGIAGFAGDVTISAIKRDLGIKDSGTLLPGHGGMLDRIDSLTYTAPLFFHFMRYFHY